MANVLKVGLKLSKHCSACRVSAIESEPTIHLLTILINYECVQLKISFCVADISGMLKTKWQNFLNITTRKLGKTFVCSSEKSCFVMIRLEIVLLSYPNVMHRGHLSGVCFPESFFLLICNYLESIYQRGGICQQYILV